jgi:hypothetical protein
MSFSVVVRGFSRVWRFACDNFSRKGYARCVFTRNRSRHELVMERAIGANALIVQDLAAALIRR